jgi:hypothetical protein
METDSSIQRLLCPCHGPLHCKDQQEQAFALWWREAWNL